MQLKTENISHYEMPKSNLLWNRTFVFCFQHKNPYGFMSIFKHLCLNVHELPTDVFPNECRSYNMSGVLFFTFSGDGGPRCSAFFSSRCVLLVQGLINNELNIFAVKRSSMPNCWGPLLIGHITPMHRSIAFSTLSPPPCILLCFLDDCSIQSLVQLFFGVFLLHGFINMQSRMRAQFCTFMFHFTVFIMCHQVFFSFD